MEVNLTDAQKNEPQYANERSIWDNNFYKETS